MKVRFTFLKHKGPKLEMGMQRKCMASDNPEGWKGKEIAGSIVWTDLHSWHVLPFSWQQDPSVQGGEVQICFLVGRNRPSVLSRKCTREALEDAATSTNLLFVLIGCLNKHQALDMAKLPSGQLSPSTTSKITIK